MRCTVWIGAKEYWFIEVRGRKRVRNWLDREHKAWDDIAKM